MGIYYEDILKYKLIYIQLLQYNGLKYKLRIAAWRSTFLVDLLIPRDLSGYEDS